MKIIILLLAILIGPFMLLDGVFVILNGKYIGPEKPGPWASIFDWFNIDVFKLGPMFIVFGLIWFVFIFGFWTDQTWARWFGIIISVLTLWYLPVGTFLSLIVLILLLMSKPAT